ncbi:hypothetical protein HanXRQr2_Chr17g0829391 [Helianthus annuus]|uniref:Uncharacterized protein n=1 Tax=Helianthus annuus TaxID=4232 RepID=A0A9K3DP37_HELAN|nr:hypothetical protein HanXRQr2_Chr17g0829391 [Helianthus annuus]
MVMFPSEEPQAKQRPSSCGAQAIELTEDLWSLKVWSWVHSFGLPSFQTITVES